MVMGPTHAVSGAAVWLYAAPIVADVVGAELAPTQLAVSTAVAAGAALLPDIDCPTSTVSRVFGLPSIAVSHVVDELGAAVYNATRTKRETDRSGGHRTLTHTAVFAVLLGGAVSVLSGLLGKVAVIGVLFLTLGLAIRGLMADWAKKNGWAATTVATTAATAAVWLLLPEENYAWLGLAVGGGCLTHLVGDMITREGCPIAWPLAYRGKRWWEFSLPGFLRIRAGGVFERMILLPALSGAAALATLNVWAPSVARHLVGTA